MDRSRIIFHPGLLLFCNLFVYGGGKSSSVALFLVGAFLKKRARLLQSLVFFLFKTDSKRRTLKVKINVQLLKVLNYWTAKGKHGERIHSLFQRYIQARTGLKFRTPPPFDFFFVGAVRFFFEFFLMSPKGPPFEFFVILLQNACL